MKRLFLLIALIAGHSPAINAQWVSPGDGTTYTFPDLVNVTNGTVVETSTRSFAITADLTISTNDVLVIDDQVKMIEASGALITIYGSMICENTGADRVWIYGNESSQFSMRFENATADIKKIYFNEGAGIKLIESDVTIDDSQFVFFSREYSSGVLDVFNCDPVIKNSSFTWNEGPAICSPANGRASVQILNCFINSNVTTEGLNMPQINLGPGGDDTIRIVGNEISGENAHWFVGGVSVADLLNTGSTKVLLKDNLITYGRYGYNQQVIENHIVHQVDDPSLGLVTFYPFVGSEGIEDVYEGNSLNDNRFYTVEGRCLGNKLPENYKGVYIFNGKKFVK